MVPGFFAGNIWHLGSFAECESIEAETLNLPGDNFRGKYMLTVDYLDGSLLTRSARNTSRTAPSLPPAPPGIKGIISLPFMLQGALYRGVCMPSTCSREEVNEAWRKTNAENYPLSPVVTEVWTQPTDEEPLTASGVWFILLITLVGVLVFLGTAIDWLLPRKKDSDLPKGQRALLSFSLITNGKTLLSTSVGKGTITSLTGIRVLSMTWVVIAHAYNDRSGRFKTGNTVKILDYYNQDLIAVIFNGTLTTDSFFFLSGFLVSYTLLREMKKFDGKFNVFMHYFHRYLRLTPVYGVFIWFTATVWPRVANGPVWGYFIPQEAAGCRKVWYQNILYYQNWMEVEGGNDAAGCLPVSWFLAVDMQLYLVAPLVIAPLFLWPIWGILFCVVLIFLSCFLRTFYFYEWEMFGDLLTDPDLFFYVYTKPQFRFGAYVVGILAAYLLIEARKRNFTFKRWQAFVGWVFFLALLAAMLFIPTPHYPVDEIFQQTNPWPIDWSRIYRGSYRTVWGFGLAWITLACDLGSGGIINWFLSWKIFIPLSRLTYCIYLIHMQVMFLRTQSEKELHDMSHMDSWFTFFAAMMVSILLASWSHLWFEAPVLGLEKIYLRTPSKKKTTKPEIR